MNEPRGLSRDYGSTLLGAVDEGPRRQRIRIQLLLTTTIVGAQLIGIVVAISLALVGIPDPSFLRGDLVWVNFLALPVYIVCSLALGVLVGTVMTVRSLKWSMRDQVPTRDDARRTAWARRRLTALQALLWVGAAVMLGIWYGVVDPILIPKVVLIVLMSGIVVIAIVNIFVDVLLRPVYAKLMQAGFSVRGSSVRSRALSAWLIGTGVPLSGVFMVVLFAATSGRSSLVGVFVSVTVLVAVAAAVGLLAMFLFSWDVTGPIRNVQAGMSKVRGGDVSPAVDLVVYDASELGELQFGFNSMVAGLREQERVRDIFGRHVGRDVAAQALRSDPELGGAERTVAVIFVDVIGSTTLATEHTPTEVVAVLNRFFQQVVEAVETHRGLVNKFEGDAVLAIFGAPLEIDDPAGAALAASREIADRLARNVPELKAGIGVSFGTVVAGNVGAIQRFEFTVIGDPVNEGARLSEAAKEAPHLPFASERAVAAAGDDEARLWSPRTALVLRGRSAQTRIYTPTSRRTDSGSGRSEDHSAARGTP
ncbi:adenylate/guanylate cyclase domain-containing protein [Gordonia sp. PS3]|uniref:Putative adenylate cyclase n=1 Tax=Gordonia sihwensis NBRC 108236 TaxID=1223544 RepID=L7LJ35_9ACTN|nr:MULTISPECIES: adenylate/guanylate cyclase domain-containing protein [Gordonia]AUH67921.1 adenylate/guanylate cyclase domain-containing protein [Gordonia sp. YC-JH1]GAC60751.1 putative adenylate cyclase [Gordonia sihwensis NBRC 108236]